MIARLVHLVHLVSHYLSLRLPAEIILPRRGFPVPAIFSPGSSYVSRDTNPNTTIPTNASSNSPHASQASDSRHMPRPRPLFLNKKLVALAKDDPYAYSSFVEGITLLAWDVAWLCKTQGFDVGSGSWNEVCNIGKNLYQLLATDRGYHSPIAMPNADLEIQGAVPKSNVAKPANAPDQMLFNAKNSLFPSFGQFSHDAVHTNLVAANGTDYMRSWRLQNPIKIIDHVKQMLLSDRTGAGWEILEGKEWEAASDTTRDRTAAATSEEASTVMVDERDRLGAEPQADGSHRIPIAEEPIQEKGRGTSGWTKLKSR